MYERIIGQTLNKMTKILLVPASPLQYILDSPGVAHEYCLKQAYSVLKCDGKEDAAFFFKAFHSALTKGLYWADRGWKNINHFYCHPGKQGINGWPDAAAECQYYFNKALSISPKNLDKGMFFFGAALHLVQDMCVPHHSLGILFDGHKEFETWASQNWRIFSVRHGIYLPFSHPAQWIDHNARLSRPFYPLVSLKEGCTENSYQKAANTLIPLTIATTAGFMEFAYKRLGTDQVLGD